jgi:DNA-binding ferritin-like protein
MLEVTMSENECISLCGLICEFRYASLVSQHLHWTVSGPTSIQDHGMLGDLYKLFDGFVDDLAERVTGLGGTAPTPMEQMKYAYACAKKAGDVNSMSGACALLCQMVEEANGVAGQGSFSEGTKNLLAGIADQLEQKAYFFKQRVK